MNCPGCSEPISVLSEFCPHCHVRVKGDTRCTSCKFVLAPSATVCPECGSKSTEPRVFENVAKSASAVTHNMAHMVTKPSKRRGNRLGRRRHSSNARPIGISNLFIALASAVGFLLLPIFEIPHAASGASSRVPTYTYWRLIKLDGSWTIIPPSSRLLLALFVVIVIAAVVQRTLQWSPIAFMTQIICALVILVTMVDAIVRARDSFRDIRSPYVVLVGAIVLAVFPWRHLERYDFSSTKTPLLDPSSDEAETPSVNLRVKNTFVAGIAAAFAVVGIVGAQAAIDATLPASSGNPFMAGASVNALLAASSGVGEFNVNTGHRILNYSGGEFGISSPLGVSSDGLHVWVANEKSNSITEFAAHSGKVVRVMSNAAYGFNGPVDAVSNGRFVFVVNSLSDSVTQLKASNGQFVRLISGTNFDFNSPAAAQLAGGRLWVSNTGSNSVAVINTYTGALIRLVVGVTSPTLMAAQGNDVWVASSASGAVARISGASGRIVAEVANANAQFSNPGGLTSLGSSLYVTDTQDNAILQYSSATGILTRTISGAQFGLTAPSAVVAFGSYLFVMNTNANSITVVEIIAGSNRLLRRFNIADVPYPGIGSLTVRDGHLWVSY